MDGISDILADFLADVLSDSQNPTDRAIRVFYTHVDDAAVIRLTVKSGMNLHPAFAVLFSEIPGKAHIGSAPVCSFDKSIKFTVVHKSRIYTDVCEQWLLCLGLSSRVFLMRSAEK